MKRRAFLQGLGVLSTLGPETLSASLNLAGQPVSYRPLLPVYEHLPQALGSHVQACLENSQVGTGALPNLRHEDSWVNGYCPLVIGLGPMAEQLIERLPSQIKLPQNVGLYRSGSPASQVPENWFSERLNRCTSALTITDLADPQACIDTIRWTRELATAEVYLQALVVLNTSISPCADEWLEALHIPVIKVRHDNTTLDPFTIVSSMLPGLPFMEMGFVCYDPYDVRTVLNTGCRASTTAVRWVGNERLTAAFHDAKKLLSPGDFRGALVWMNVADDFHLREYDETAGQLQAWLPDDALTALIAIPRANLEEGERILNITVMEA